MANVELIMPKMGESIMEATILKWLKQEGDTIEEDESVLEIATDKVDSEVPSPQAGVITKLLYAEGDVVEVGKPIAIIATEGEGAADTPVTTATPQPEPQKETVAEPVAATANVTTPVAAKIEQSSSNGSNRFYSPLVMNIARQEGIAMNELETIPGTGKNDRVTKRDILSYLENRGTAPVAEPVVKAAETVQTAQPTTASTQPAPTPQPSQPVNIPASGNVEIVEMDRMRQVIAKHMVNSKATSAHVTSFVEADVTNMVQWRDKVKGRFQEREGEKLTFTPLFVEAIVKVLKDYPWVNASVDGSKVIVRKDYNIGMATALPTGNLIVPVIKGADQLNLVGLSKKVNDLANRARQNKLKPDEIDGGTFTLSNVGTFGNLMGTPIINQPQVAILATGAIKKKPVVIETEMGDMIAIRHMMFLSMSYDHRIVDGAMGGSFIRKLADELEAFDTNRQV